MKKLIFIAVPVTILTIIFGTIYTSGQQILRMNANDPQVQLAEDVADKLLGGADPGQFVNSKTSAGSLAPFIIIYDHDGKELASSVELNGQTPQIPSGVLQHAKPGSDNRVTWQVDKYNRVATVVVNRGNNYVLAGRNIREVESREDSLLLVASLGWALSVATLGGALLAKVLLKRSVK